MVIDGEVSVPGVLAIQNGKDPCTMLDASETRGPKFGASDFASKFWNNLHLKLLAYLFLILPHFTLKLTEMSVYL